MTRRQQNCDRQLALWRAFEATYLSLCDEGQIKYDYKVMRALFEEFCADQRSGFPSLFPLTH